MKKKNTTLYKKIIIIFLVILALSTTVTDVLRYVAFRKECERHAREVTKQSATQLSYLLKKEEVDACIDEPEGEMAEGLKQTLTDLCAENGLKYIYIYVPDFEKGTALYYVAVAGDSKVNEEIKKSRYPGKVVGLTTEILEANEQAWNGEDATISYKNQYGDVATSFAVLTDEGENYALVGVDYDSKGYTTWSVRAFIIKLVAGLIIYIILFVVLIAFMKKRVIKHILHISDRMGKFVSDIEERDFTPIEINTGDEIEAVANSFNLMAGEISSYIEEVKKWAAKEAKIATELDVARHIQHGVVAERKDIKLCEGFEFSGRMSPAKEVGGDFYDSFPLPDGRYCVLIGDVSGKGIAAAMFMMHVKATLHEKLIISENAALALQRANDEICQNNPENMFATVFVAILDGNEDVIFFVNAGHNEPVIIRNNEVISLKVCTGIALGVFEDMEFTLEQTEFRNGDSMYIYTDGVTDCVNENKEFFGKERVLKVLDMGAEEVSSKDISAKGYCDTILEELSNYRGKEESFDDITMVCVKKI